MVWYSKQYIVVYSIQLQYIVYSKQYIVKLGKYIVYSKQYSIQYIVYSIVYIIYSIQYIVHSIQYIVYIVYSISYIVQWRIFRVKKYFGALGGPRYRLIYTYTSPQAARVSSRNLRFEAPMFYYYTTTYLLLN